MKFTAIQINVIGILENCTANRRLVLPPWNRVKCLSVQFGGSVLISKSSFADKSTVPWYMLSNLLRYFEENNLKRDNSTVCQQSIFTQNQTMSKIRHSFWPVEHRLVSKIIIAYR